MKPTITYTRAEARQRILAAANAHRQRRNLKAPLRMHGYLFMLPPYTARHLQQAVHVCRQRLLVSPDVLVAAGFRGVR